MILCGDLWILSLLNLNFPFEGVLGEKSGSGMIWQMKRSYFL